jgi:uncharacterized membrane protein YsdA (DUF1294 family)
MIVMLIVSAIAFAIYFINKDKPEAEETKDESSYKPWVIY